MNDIYTLKSAVSSIDKPIDCRRLQLSVKYHLLNAAQVSQMCNETMRFLYDAFSSNAIFDWMYGSKKVNSQKALDLLCEPFAPNTEIRVGFSGYMPSDVIYNLTTLRKHERTITRVEPLYAYGWDAGFLESIDFPEYFDSCFAQGNLDNEEILDKIFNIFCQTNRRYTSFHVFADLGGSFCANPYKTRPGYYFGTASFWISAFCAEKAVDSLAEWFSLFAQRLSEKYININAHIRLQPQRTYENPYMRYFGDNVVIDGTHSENGCSPREWYPYYYLCGVEWLNILSPLTRGLLLSDPAEDQTRTQYIWRNLKGGGLLIKSAWPISSYDRVAALEIKNIILDTLYPGKTAIPMKGLFPKSGGRRIYSWCPRSDWEVVPIERDEIGIIGTDLVYISKNSMTYEDI